MEDEVARAIQIAYEPSADSTLKQQAFQYVNELRTDPRGWQACLALVIKIPRYQQVVRHFSLEIVSNAVQAGLIESNGLGLLKDQLLQYLHNTLGRQEISGSTSEPTSPVESDSGPDPPVIHNKIAQTLTDLFCNLYASGWETCFDDLLSLTSIGGSRARDNAPGIVFYLRVLNSVHDEIGDQLLSRSTPEQSRANMLKDLIRERDIQKIAASWQEILSQWGDRNDLIAELCLKAIGKWVSWIDIGLVVNRPMLDLLFRQLMRAQKTGLNSQEELTRAAAIDVFTEITGKKMKSQDKIEMIAFLDLENVIAQLNMCPPLNEHRGGPLYDTDLAETVAKLVNVVVVDIVRVLDHDPPEQGYWQQAERMLQSFLPLVLRFFADEYDEVCSTVIPAISDILSFLRNMSRNEPNSPQRTVMLLPILKAIFAKMRYDETSSWSDEGDQTDEAEFQELRKRLHVLQNTIAAADEQLYIDAVTSLVESTFDKFRTQQIDWRDLDLALHEMLMFADVATKAGGLYQKNKPNSTAAERLLQMMDKMMQCNVQTFNHPATQIQYMEICIRYNSFFEHYTQYVQGALQSFLSLVHHDLMRVRTRAWYLFHRFVRHLRGHVGAIAETIVENLKDLLPIKAEIPDDDGDDASSDDHPSPDAVFSDQLYLFEAIGSMCGAASVPADRQAYLAQSIMSPIFADIEHYLTLAKSSDERAILQVHHDIMALGTLARGISDWVPGTSTPRVPPPVEVREAFSRVSEATLVTLESLSTSYTVREASRFTFSRLIGVLGSEILPSLPRWIEGLLVQNSTNDELALFLRLLDQIVFGFKTEIFPILDTLLTPFLQRVFSGFSQSASGTDDEIQLAELKREYINFLLVLFNNDLSSVVVSEVNQPNFEAVIGTIEYFAKDAEDLPTAKMAFQALSKMCSTWGGPDITAQSNGTTPQPVLPGFDRFMITRFSPLCWSLPKSATLNTKDAQARQALAEAAALQKVIFTKCGQEYVEWLRVNELREMGMNERMMEEYLEALSRLDIKAFKGFFPQFVGRESGAG